MSDFRPPLLSPISAPLPSSPLYSHTVNETQIVIARHFSKQASFRPKAGESYHPSALRMRDVHTHTHTHTHTCTHAHTHTRTYTHTYTHGHTGVHTQRNTCAHTYSTHILAYLKKLQRHNHESKTHTFDVFRKIYTCDRPQIINPHEH